MSLPTTTTAIAAAPEPSQDDALSPSYLAELTPHGLTAAPARPAPQVDPRLTDYALPAEWDVHERTLVTWPSRPELWGGAFERAKLDYAALIRAIAAFEPVTVIAPPGQRREVNRHCGQANLDVLEAPTDDSWIRDNGPLVVRRPDGHRLGVDFAFNSWGRKFLPYDADDALSARVLAHLGIERVAVDLVMEGGSITVDGEGTLVTTAQCLLHSNRNPHLSEADIVDTLRRTLGVRTVLMLPFGHLDDRHTDGHVDGVATFTAPGRAIVQTSADSGNINHEAMARNLRYLRDNADARGRMVTPIGLELFSAIEVEGITDYIPYANFYIANGAVIAPTSGNRGDDEQALAVLAEEFPDRTIVPVPGAVLAFGGGGPHCITLQIPAALPSPGGGSQ